MEDRESNKTAYAHGLGHSGEMQFLDQHLLEVAELCKRFSGQIGMPSCGFLLGYWHDIGKNSPEWQEYLRKSISDEKENGKSIKGPAHSPVGALRARAIWPIAMVIAAHHSQLLSKAQFRERLREYNSDKDFIATVDSWNHQEIEILQDTIENAKHEIESQIEDENSLEFLIRFFLSALVDADRLDTEAHFTPERTRLRGSKHDLKWMKNRLDTELNRITNDAEETKVNTIRGRVLNSCRDAASEPQGVFRLTAPTGAGKTFSSLAFALDHAVHHSLERIIVAIPYTSIIDQTASAYRRILNDDCVLEHHSAVSEIDEVTGESVERNSLAVENWDHHLIVTTTNQLFESLMSNRPSRCRKIHNLVRSVIILDEVQTLPVELLQTTVESIRFLTSHCDTTVVLCTATQPDISSNRNFKGLADIREILPDARELFASLRRVEYLWPERKQSWSELGKRLLQERQALAVVNTKRDALLLLDSLDESEALHLSTSLCGAHRKEVIREIRSRLRNGEYCRVVSTQVVEAGVDLDFPVVMRAVGPLDRIVQVAGRCNREGRLNKGKVIIFDPEDGKLPPGAYTTGYHEARSLISEGELDPDDPGLFERYFARLYSSVDTDRFGIEELRKHLDYPEVAERYRFIRDNTTPVVIAGWQSDETEPIFSEIRIKLKHGGILTRDDFRRIQPYVVNIREREYRENLELIDDSIPGMPIWKGPYDHNRGLITEYTRTEDNLW